MCKRKKERIAILSTRFFRQSCKRKRKEKLVEYVVIEYVVIGALAYLEIVVLNLIFHMCRAAMLDHVFYICGWVGCWVAGVSEVYVSVVSSFGKWRQSY